MKTLYSNPVYSSSIGSVCVSVSVSDECCPIVVEDDVVTFNVLVMIVGYPYHYSAGGEKFVAVKKDEHGICIYEM